MAIDDKISIMHVIDLMILKIYRSKNKHISVNFLRHLHRAGDHHQALPVCIYEDVIMKKCLTLLIATVLSGISLHGLCRATDE